MGGVVASSFRVNTVTKNSYQMRLVDDPKSNSQIDREKTKPRRLPVRLEFYRYAKKIYRTGQLWKRKEEEDVNQPVVLLEDII